MSNSGFLGRVEMDEHKVLVGKYENQNYQWASIEMSGEIFECQDINLQAPFRRKEKLDASLSVSLFFDDDPGAWLDWVPDDLERLCIGALWVRDQREHGRTEGRKKKQKDDIYGDIYANINLALDWSFADKLGFLRNYRYILVDPVFFLEDGKDEPYRTEKGALVRYIERVEFRVDLEWERKYFGRAQNENENTAKKVRSSFTVP